MTLGQTIDLRDKLGRFDSTWTPHIIAELNGQLVKLAKLEGEFTWHAHADEDELFLVIEGELEMQIRDSAGAISSHTVRPGQIFVVPRGVEHNPVAKPGTAVMLFEPAATKHTGEKILERTVIDQARI